MAESEAATVNEEPTSKEESNHSSSCWSPKSWCSPFKGGSSASDVSDKEGSQHYVVQYLCEPEWESDSEAESGAPSDGKNRLEEQ